MKLKRYALDEEMLQAVQLEVVMEHSLQLLVQGVHVAIGRGRVSWPS